MWYKAILLQGKGVIKSNKKETNKNNQVLEGGWIAPPSLDGSKARNRQGLELGFLTTEAKGCRACRVPHFVFTRGRWDTLKAPCIYMPLGCASMRGSLGIIIPRFPFLMSFIKIKTLSQKQERGNCSTWNISWSCMPNSRLYQSLSTSRADSTHLELHESSSTLCSLKALCASCTTLVIIVQLCALSRDWNAHPPHRPPAEFILHVSSQTSVDLWDFHD